jgi:hypothetical protein
LVTDPVELQEEPKTPPTVLASEIPIGSIIRFDAKNVNTLTIPLRVRNEDIDETLKVRYRTVGITGTSAFKCNPEIEIPPTGTLIRDFSPAYISLEATAIPRGSCTKIEYVVSGSFQDCKFYPDRFDVTTDPNDDNDLGRATFWVWETSNDVLMNPMGAQFLLNTCKVYDMTTNPTQMPVAQ